MPQMSPILWTPILILTSIMLMIIKLSIYFEKTNVN
nr:ATP synthase F0 subunit 8 [Cixiidae sp.]